MDFDKTIGVYLENTEWKGRTDIGCLLNGCRQMYAATQDERYQKFILQYVEKMSEEWENAFSKTDVTKKINAGRVDNHMNTDYKGSLEELIETVLDRI